MNWIQRLLSADDPTASMMRVMMFTVLVNAIIMWNYITFIRTAPMSLHEASLIQNAIGFALAGKAAQSFAENKTGVIGSKL